MNKAEKFKKPQFKLYYTPEDAYDELFNPEDFIPPGSGPNAYSTKGRDLMFGTHVLFEYSQPDNMYLHHAPPHGPFEVFEDSVKYKPHHLLLGIKFKGQHDKARQYILYKYLETDIPYIRVSGKFYKKHTSTTRYGNKKEHLSLWPKDSIVDDFGKSFIKRIPKFDGFVNVPNNIQHRFSYDGMYNMYRRFLHKPHDQRVGMSDIPTIAGLMKHIFGDQLVLGYQFFKVMYEDPKQKLPVLCLASAERQTGKTTMLNFIQMIFGENFGIINSEMLTSQFNSSYAHLNIIGIDETVIEKASAVEKIKMLATADSLLVNMKNVNTYPVEFFGKIVLATNKESDFMRIDSEEIRFWIRKPGPVKTVDRYLNDKLLAEIPKFLRYLSDMEWPEYKTRMVFTPEQINNEQLEVVKSESKSNLHKDIEMRIASLFDDKPGMEYFKAAPLDIKRAWYENNSRIDGSYIRKVLKDEMKLEPPKKAIHYTPFKVEHAARTGRAYTFKREQFVNADEEVDNKRKEVKELEEYEDPGF